MKMLLIQSHNTIPKSETKLVETFSTTVYNFEFEKNKSSSQ